MDHLLYIDFFRTAAKKHKDIADGKIVAGTERKSFFRVNGEREMQQALMGNAAFPALCLSDYQGRLSGMDKDLVHDNIYGSFEVRDHVTNATNFDEVETVRDTCKRIAHEVLAYMLHDGATRKCSPFKGMDITSVRYEFTGPINTQEFGCMVFFVIPGKAEIINDTDIDAVFNL